MLFQPVNLTGQQRGQLRESQDFRSAIFDLRQGERREDASIEQRRTDSLATVESDQAARAIEINERIATVLENIATQQTDAQTSATGAISEAEAGAGITFAEAQSAFVPAADAMTVALTTLNDTIAGINTGETEAIAGVDDTFADVLVKPPVCHSQMLSITP